MQGKAKSRIRKIIMVKIKGITPRKIVNVGISLIRPDRA